MKKSFGGASRFSALEIEDISESDEDVKSTSKKSTAEKNAKKRARKKKKAVKASELNNELRNLAFSKPVSTKAIQHEHEKRHVLNGDLPQQTKQNDEVEHKSIDPLSWEQWKNKDEEFVVDQFQKDLEAALKISADEVSKSQKNLENSSKNKKKSNKKQTMSLEEFQNSLSEVKPVPSQNPSHSNLIPENTKFTIKNGYCPEELDPYHFGLEIPREEMENLTIADVAGESHNKKINKKKKKKRNPNSLTEALNEMKNDGNSNKEQSKNIQIDLDDVTLLSMKSQLDEKDELIFSLQKEMNNLKEELASVKKRNKQLCFILGQAEMKEKSDILLQVDELTTIKNELSVELSSTYTALEQERSRVSSLKTELNKYQNVRTRMKSTSDEK